MLKRSVLGLALVSLAVPAITLAAAVGPTGAQRTAILKAWGSHSRAQSACMIVKLAASNRSYGAVRPRIIRSCRRWEFDGVNVIKRTRDNTWKLVFEGSDYRCPMKTIPRGVQRDLGVCPFKRNL
jgi:hypothetical protein